MEYLRALPLGRARRVVRIAVGFSTLLVGILMIVLPGPAIVFIPLGLGILASEYIWAKRLLDRIKDQVRFKKK